MNLLLRNNEVDAIIEASEKKAGVSMESAVNSRPDLAAALFHLIGASVPINYEEEEEARKLYASLSDDHARLRKVIALCGTPKTPQQLYLAAKATSWLGGCEEQTAKYAQTYLESTGWDRLFCGTVTEDGITVSRRARSRADLYAILAQAQENMGKHEAALANYAEAYRLEPFEAMYAVKLANVIERSRSRKEALQFLLQQLRSPYYRPLHYKDEHGNACINQTFRQLIDAQILRLQTEKE